MPTKVVISQDPTFESENILGGEDHGLLSNTVDSNLVDDTGLGGMHFPVKQGTCVSLQ